MNSNERTVKAPASRLCGLEETMNRPYSQKKLMMGFLLTASILFLAAAATVAAEDDYDAVFKNADAKFSQGSYEEALKLYKRANGMRKNNYECLCQVAQAQNKLGRYGDALKTADKLIKINSANPARQSMGWNLRGRTLFFAAIDDPRKLNMKLILKSESAIREALKINPNLNLAHYNLGIVLMRMDRTDEGLAELQMYIRNAEEPDIAEQARMIIHTPKIPVPNLELMRASKPISRTAFDISTPLELQMRMLSLQTSLELPNRFRPAPSARRQWQRARGWKSR